jgi:hypothetical protein
MTIDVGSISNLFFILAAICFFIGAVQDGWLHVNWGNAGLCCVTIALWLV